MTNSNIFINGNFRLKRSVGRYISKDPLIGYNTKTDKRIKFVLYNWVTSHPYYKEGRKEGNVLFNDALNTFYLRLYGITHMVKDHSDSERELCYTSRRALAGTRNSSIGPP